MYSVYHPLHEGLVRAGYVSLFFVGNEPRPIRLRVLTPCMGAWYMQAAFFVLGA